MFDEFSIDDSTLAKLPLPLAQLFRRALNAKTPLEQHLAAARIAELGLKLLACGAIVDIWRWTSKIPGSTNACKTWRVHRWGTGGNSPVGWCRCWRMPVGRVMSRCVNYFWDGPEMIFHERRGWMPPCARCWKSAADRALPCG